MYAKAAKLNAAEKSKQNRTIAEMVSCLPTKITAFVLDAAGIHSSRAVLAAGVGRVIVPNNTKSDYDAVVRDVAKHHLQRRVRPVQTTLEAAVRRHDRSVKISCLVADTCGFWRNLAPTLLFAFQQGMFSDTVVISITLYITRDKRKDTITGQQNTFQSEFASMASEAGYAPTGWPVFSNYGLASGLLFYAVTLARHVPRDSVRKRTRSSL